MKLMIFDEQGARQVPVHAEPDLGHPGVLHLVVEDNLAVTSGTLLSLEVNEDEAAWLGWLP
jgi:hypothetical protein